MATESNKQSASIKEEGSAVSVDTVEGTARSRRPRFRFGKPALILIIIVLVAAGFIVVKKEFHIGEKVYAQAAGHRIYKQDITSLIGKTSGITQHQAATVLADQSLTQAMAKKAGITVTNQDLTAQYSDINSQRIHNKYAYQDNVNTVYFNKLMAYNTGLYKGEVLVANFSRNIAFQSPYIDIQKATNPSLGDPTAVAADKKYAHDFITKLYNQLKSNQISFDQAVQAEHNDPQVGEKAYQTLPHSGPFDTSNVYLGGTSLISPPSIKQKIASIKAGQLTPPFAVSVGNSWTDKSVMTDSYYLVVRMDSTQGSHSGLPWAKYLAQAKQQYHYKLNV